MMHRRSLAISCVTLALLYVPALRIVPTAHAESPAGHWSYFNVVLCTRTPANAGVCNFLLGPGSITTFVNALDATCDAGGHCSYHAWFLAVGTAPGNPAECDPNIFINQFNGRCNETESGTIALSGPPSATGLRDFAITDEYASYHGTPPLLNLHDPAGAGSYPLDTANPAVPGVYGTQQYLSLIGALAPNQPVPSGVTFLLIVSHH